MGLFGENPMKGFTEDFVGMCDEGRSIGESFQAPDMAGVANIVVCGLGGSGVCGDLLVDVAKLRVPIITVKDYHLPKFVDEKSLVFLISYSGNTEETLSQFMQARNLGCRVVTVTSGGKLKEWSEKDGVPCVVIPSGRNPRDALPLMFFPLLMALQKMGYGSFGDEMEECKEVVKKMDLRKMDELANKIKNSRIAVYGTSDHVGSLRRMKNEFNENAKMAIIYDFFPELNHNEMNGYQRTGLTKNVDVIILRDKFETEEMSARIEVTKGILEHYVNSINEIWCSGESKLSRTMSFVFIASYMTGKIASLVGINRSSVPFVDRLKDSLKSRTNVVERLDGKMKSETKK